VRLYFILGLGFRQSSVLTSLLPKLLRTRCDLGPVALPHSQSLNS